MKFLKCLLPVLIFCCALPVANGQSMQKPMDSKSIIQQMYDVAKRTPLDSSVYKIDSLVIASKVACGTTDNPRFCLAGLDFVQGYCYQNAYEEGDGNTTFLSKAIEAYKNVLLQYPDNEAALSNLIVLAIETVNHERIVQLLNDLIAKFPNYKNEYLVGLGTIYQSKGDIDGAIVVYKEALAENQSSVEAIEALTNIYLTKQESIELSEDDIIKLAIDAYSEGLPNYSADIYEHLFLKSYGKEQLIRWVFINAENDWLKPIQLADLKKGLPANNDMIKWLDELLEVFETENPDSLTFEFWGEYDYFDKIQIGRHEGISARSALLRVLHNRGNDALNEDNPPNYQLAEQFWRLAMSLAGDNEDPFFTKVAADLAQSYQEQGIPINQRGFKSLIREIFEGKGQSYAEKDYKMIREYHITLGTIYYRNKKWKGGYATNARFQLSRALDNRFGPITNPDLRAMLGDVYRETNEHGLAIRMYLESIEEFLLLDRIDEAEAFHIKQSSYFDRQNLSDKQRKRVDALEKMINWRKDFMNSDNQFLTGEATILEYLVKIQTSQNEISENLDEEFVRLQFFKGLSDLADQISPANEYDKQLCNSASLEKLTDVGELQSPQDIVRLKNIQLSLEKSVVQSQEHQKIQYRSLNSDTLPGYKIYQMPTLEKEILIPDKVFEINDILQGYYGENQDKIMATIKYENGRYVRIKS